MRRTALALLGCVALLAHAADIPKLTRAATDLTGTLSGDQLESLHDASMRLQAEKGSQVVVLVVPTTEPDSIEAYAVKAFEQNRIGRKGIDDGVLLLVAKDDRKVRIEVGYGLEGAIPDIYANRIIEEYITPEFKAGRFDAGVAQGFDRIASLVRGEALPPPTETPIEWTEMRAPFRWNFWPPGLVIGLLVAVALTRFRNPRDRKRGAPVLGAFSAALSAGLVWLLGGLEEPMIVAAMVGVALGMPQSKKSVVASGSASRDYDSGSSYSSSSSSSSSSSWSGGGGRSGGGGASGSW